MTKWINVGLDKSISDSKCYPLVAEAGSLRDCQAKCTARALQHGELARKKYHVQTVHVFKANWNAYERCTWV